MGFGIFFPPDIRLQLDRIEQKLDALLKGEIKMSTTIAQAFADLQTQVAQSVTVEQGAVTLLQNLSSQLKAALEAEDPAAIEAIAAQMSASANTLAKAITDNTPASS